MLPVGLPGRSWFADDMAEIKRSASAHEAFGQVLLGGFRERGRCSEMDEVEEGWSLDSVALGGRGWDIARLGPFIVV